MRTLFIFLIIAGLLMAGLLPAHAAGLTPDFYLPTGADLPPGVELQQAPGPTPIGADGDKQEQRIYASRRPPALLGVTIITGATQRDSQRYVASQDAFLREGYTVSRPNSSTDGTIDLELVKPGSELSQRVRIVLIGGVLGLVSVTSRNDWMSDTEAIALAESIAAPMWAKMRVNPASS